MSTVLVLVLNNSSLQREEFERSIKVDDLNLHPCVVELGLVYNE